MYRKLQFHEEIVNRIKWMFNNHIIFFGEIYNWLMNLKWRFCKSEIYTMVIYNSNMKLKYIKHPTIDDIMNDVIECFKPEPFKLIIEKGNYD